MKHRLLLFVLTFISITAFGQAWQDGGNGLQFRYVGGFREVRQLVKTPQPPFAITDSLNAKGIKQNSLAIDGTGVKYPTVDAVNKGNKALSVNYYDLYNNDSDGITKTSGTIKLIQEQNPSAYKNILRYTPSISIGQGFSFTLTSEINPNKATTVGFWVDKSRLDNGIYLALSYYDSLHVNMGGFQDVYINNSDIEIIGLERVNGYLKLKVLEINGDWVFLQMTHSINPTKLAARYYGQNFLPSDNLADKYYDFAGFTLINDGVELNPYSNYAIPYNRIPDKWRGKKVVWAGDSIFAVDKSQQVSINDLGIISINKAVSGSTVTPGYGNDPAGGVSTLELVDSIINKNPDAVYINAGTNDYGYGVPLGEMSDTVTTTFYGAYKKMLHDLLVGLPNATILISTPIYGNLFDDDPIIVYKARKLYTDAIIEICNLYGVPVLDKFRTSGIGIFNYESKLSDGIHPTDATYKELGILDRNFIIQSSGVSKFNYSLNDILNQNNEADKPIVFKLPSSETAQILESYSNPGYGFSINQDEVTTGDWFLKRVIAGVYSDVFRAQRSTGNVIFSGNVTAANLSGTNTGDQNLSGYAPLASPALTGSPTSASPPTTATALLRYTDLGTGFAQYTDNSHTSGSPQVVNSGATATITNNAATTIAGQLPIGVTSFYNSGTSKITPQNDGDSYLINVRFTAVSSSNTGLADVGIDIGGAMNIIAQETISLRKGAGQAQKINIIFDVFSGSTFLANGGLIKLSSIDGNTSIYDISYKVTRTHKAK